MKVHYFNILLFSLPLNIILLSSQVYNQRNHILTLHKSTTTSRVLSECDLYMPKYDNDADMKSVKENFDRQTSQRFEEFDERMKDKRRKCKEQCEKDIQKIILKDKIEKSLEEKVEKYCLICGCGLGGGVAPFVGLFGGLAVNELKKAAAAAATEAGIKEAIKGLGKIYAITEGTAIKWTEIIHAGNYNHKMSLITIVNSVNSTCEEVAASERTLFCKASYSFTESGRRTIFTQTISEMAGNAAEDAGKAASGKLAEMTSVGTICSNPVVISAIVVVIIAVILLIIYLILRYSRKQKMNKKDQYTKLLNE
ncbi:hypothetical protein PFMALIP_00388 [Plasmodium falciparum MaliPS096_E11]|uniref:Surface antigen n=1 Tax=Plasmodium falciparum MaliPS096_E11 TaxID=1036727 RepID=A0A024WXR1_PLAFA|nr:hypothetical protein PFMALIP_00388 [Plasmodium falciparum MaliPS096_E11]